MSKALANQDFRSPGRRTPRPPMNPLGRWIYARRWAWKTSGKRQQQRARRLTARDARLMRRDLAALNAPPKLPLRTRFLIIIVVALGCWALVLGIAWGLAYLWWRFL